MLFLYEVDFTHETAATPLFENVDLALAAGWTGVVGANGAGKTTLLRLAVAELSPRAGTIRVPGTALYCPQRTDHQPTRLSELVSATDADARRTCGRLSVGADWPGRWETLSHGERKRAQIAVALWQAPDVLAIDEPTNHLDSEARNWLAQALHTYAGIGLLVSHDRELLDELCSQCLFLDPPSVVVRPGGYTEAARQAEGERPRRASLYAPGVIQRRRAKPRASAEQPPASTDRPSPCARGSSTRPIGGGRRPPGPTGSARSAASPPATTTPRTRSTGRAQRGEMPWPASCCVRSTAGFSKPASGRRRRASAGNKNSGSGCPGLARSATSSCARPPESYPCPRDAGCTIPAWRSSPPIVLP